MSSYQLISQLTGSHWPPVLPGNCVNVRVRSLGLQREDRCVCVCVRESTAGLPADCPPPPTLFPLNIWAALLFLFFVATLLMCLDVLNVCGGSRAVSRHFIRVEQMKTVSGRFSEAFYCDIFQTSWLEFSTRDPVIRAHEGNSLSVCHTAGNATRCVREICCQYNNKNWLIDLLTGNSRFLSLHCANSSDKSGNYLGRRVMRVKAQVTGHPAFFFFLSQLLNILAT